MLWDDRLVEVWAQPGRAGTGVLVGETGVLTARHVVEGAIAAPGGRLLSRVVVPGGTVGEWVGMEVKWDDERWDVAVLAVDPDSPKADTWPVPRSEPVVIVALGSRVEDGCEAVGFPQSEVQHAHGEADSSPGVRQTEQAWGMVMPAGQGKSPVNPDRPLLPGRWMPFDVINATPGTRDGWRGVSGAGVLTADGRLIGLVKAAEVEHQERRLYVVPLAAVIEKESGFVEALEELTGRRPVAQVRSAALWSDLLEEGCLGEDGLPAPIGVLDDLSVFGVKPASIAGEPPFLDYVPRDAEDELLEALDAAVESGRMLLVVGGSAAGKSRSLARALAARLADRRLVAPLERGLRDVVSAPVRELGQAVVWLDDVQRFKDQSMAETLKRLRQARVVVVGTIRLAELKALTPGGELRDPIGEALADHRLVQQIDWRTKWSPEERARVADHVSSPRVLEAIARGVPLGAYCVSGPSLVARLESARRDEINPVPYALVRTVLDWYRTGITQPIPVQEARRLTAERLEPDDAGDSAMLDEALTWALTPETPPPRGTPAQTFLAVDGDRGLSVHDYVLDHDQIAHPGDIPNSVWQAALAVAGPGDGFSIGLAAYEAGKPEIARAAMEPLAEFGDPSVMFTLGVFLKDIDPGAAREWYEKAAEAGDAGAMNNLGRLLEASDRQTARYWFEKAADAGYAGGMNNLGRLLMESDPQAARAWWEKAANAGQADAMFNLGLLLERSHPRAAGEWYEKAANAGHSGAMFNLGVLLQGSDEYAARYWYEKAANAGHSGAMFNLGVLIQGSDEYAARYWYEKAANAGHSGAMFNLGVLIQGSDEYAARYWYEKAANAGQSGAMFNLGVLIQGSDPRAARYCYEKAANAGHTDAMNNLGLLLVENDTETARQWWERAANAGQSGAMFNLGVLLRDTDPRAARQWWQKAGNAGHARAMFNVGVLLEDSDPDAARRWYEQAANAGHTDAMVNLGLLLEDSDPDAARRWYEQAANAGNIDAMNNLGVLLRDTDPRAARQWWEKAGNAGNIHAMFSLGLLLVENDTETARQWWEKAANAGHSDTMFNLGLLLVGNDTETARQWWEKAANAGHTRAMFNLGLLLRDSDEHAARYWYEKAANAGHIDAMVNLGLLLEASDPDAARRWYEQAASAGNTHAMNNLALLLQDSNPEAARDWFEKAATAGHVVAMTNLGVLLLGNDPRAARDWFEKAATAGNATAMNNLAVLLKDSDPRAARDWRAKAATARNV